MGLNNMSAQNCEQGVNTTVFPPLLNKISIYFDILVLLNDSIKVTYITLKIGQKLIKQ